MDEIRERARNFDPKAYLHQIKGSQGGEKEAVQESKRRKLASFCAYDEMKAGNERLERNRFASENKTK